MSTLKMKPVATMAAACVLSLVSAAAFAGRMGAAPAGGTARASGTHAVDSTRMSGRDAATTRMSAPAAAPTTGATARAATTRPATTTRRTGQPNASCEDTPNQPGHSISAPGSAFNPDGVAGTKYAGEQPQNSRNPKSVSQYDVACTRPSH